MVSDLAIIIAKLRICVAFLGEKDQQNWWSSSFLSDVGKTFLKPVFPKTTFLASVTGASSAARVVHDEHIGLGNVFHLFRLPENIENDILYALKNEPSILDNIRSEDDAYASLQSMTNGDVAQSVGPFLLSQVEIDQTTISYMAAVYLAGFKNNQNVYPYYKNKA
jgi:hypothetical protein